MFLMFISSDNVNMPNYILQYINNCKEYFNFYAYYLIINLKSIVTMFACKINEGLKI